MEIRKVDNLEIRIFADLEELSHHASQLFVSACQRSDIFTVAVSGGSTPKRMFELLAADYREKISWSKIHVFWGDERAESNHPESNFQIVSRLWLNHVPANIHPIKIELGLIEAARVYTQEINSLAPNGFDLVFNGAGVDGHRNGVMPENLQIGWQNGIWDLPESAKVWEYKVPSEINAYSRRITLTPWFLNRSKINVLMLSGRKKAELLRQMTINENKYSKRELPVLTFNEVPTIVLADKMAASQL